MKTRSYSCRWSGCGQVFTSLMELRRHRLDEHQRGAGDEASAEDISHMSAGIEDEDILRTFKRHVFAIARRRERLDAYRYVYNFPLRNGSIDMHSLLDMVREIYQDQLHPFRLNFAFGFILDHVQRQPDDAVDQDDESSMAFQPRYFHPFRNTHVLPRAFALTSWKDVEKLRKKLESRSFMDELLKDRPDSKWRLSLLTNVSFDVTLRGVDVPLGCSDASVPAFLSRKTSLKNVAAPYADNLCFFYCLSHFLGARGVQLKQRAMAYFLQWNKGECDVDAFQGILLEDFESLEQTFKVNITVFALREDGRAETVRASCADFDKTLYLNLWQNHLMLVTSPSGFSGRYVCMRCDRIFKSAWTLKRHMKGCRGVTDGTERKFVGGYVRSVTKLPEQLQEICIDEGEDWTYRWFACIDTESILRPMTEEQDPCSNSFKLAEHELVSVAISSNVPGFEQAVCFLEPDPREVVVKMLGHLHAIQQVASELMREQLSRTIEELQQRVDEEAGAPAKVRKKTEQLFKQLETYVDSLPVLTFNGSGYDYPLLARHLLPLLELQRDSKAYTVKRCNAYLCIATSKFRFLDAMLFLSAGTSYDQFLLTYSNPGEKAPERKSHFPYEKVTSFDVLNSGFPSYDDFFSKLKNCNTLEREHVRYQALMKDGLSSEQALSKMGLKSVPLTGQEEYLLLREEFHRCGYTKLGELLVAYNIQDVKPFTKAFENLWGFYMSLGVNILKECMTVAGVARELIFRTARQGGYGFSLLNKKDEGLYDLLSEAVVGGPSLVFCRHQEVGKTNIRGDSGESTKRVVSWDANSLYLGALGEEMPVGPYIHRTAEKNFKPERREKHLISFIWLDWVAQKENIVISHALNSGAEVLIATGHKVDGYHHETKTCYQFDGCYYHGCSCVKIDPEDGKKKKQLEERRQKTEETKSVIEADGRYRLVSMKECQFRKMMADDPELNEFVQSWDPTFLSGKTLEQKDVLEAIEEGRLFGFVSAQVSLPNSWNGKFQHPLSPQELYEIFPPLFVNRLVSFDDVGEFTQKCIVRKQLEEKADLLMQEHERKCRIEGVPLNRALIEEQVKKIRFVKPKPQRMLVSLMNCDRLVVSTTLLQWYIQNGFDVTVLEVIQYQGKKCFQPFVKMVTEQRQLGGGGIQSRTMKVVGNSGLCLDFKFLLSYLFF